MDVYVAPPLPGHEFPDASFIPFPLTLRTYDFDPLAPGINGNHLVLHSTITARIRPRFFPSICLTKYAIRRERKSNVIPLRRQQLR